MRRGLPLALALAVALAPRAGGAGEPAQPSGSSLEGLDEFVREAMKDWKVPGAAVGVIKNGQIILARGYGQRDVKRGLPVTPRTMFAIASATKSFAVSSLGLLVDEGLIEWDRPVREYIPSFRLFDHLATERTTARDLVTHRSGLPRHDLTWYNSTATRQELFNRLRYLEPSRDFRSSYQYQNLMYMTAGYIAGHVAHARSWEDLARERLFKPLGMKSTNFSVTASQKTTDFALPYKKKKEEVVQIPFRVVDELGPAGSINSNVEDMLRYLQMHVGKGKVGETRILSEDTVNQMQSPQVVVPGALRHPEVGHTAYGMGWFVTTYRGHKLVHHGGNLDGFAALVSFMPQEGIGVVVLSNLTATSLPTLISYNVYERLLGTGLTAWSERLKDDEKKQKAGEEEAKQKGFTIRRPGTRPSHELADYAGEFEHPGYGVATIAVRGEGLELTYNRLTAAMQHFHYDVFEVPEDPLNPLEKMKVSFRSSLRGDIDSVLLPFESSVHEIVFTRRPDRRMTEPSFLAPLLGSYELGPLAVSIVLRGPKALAVIIPGQPARELIPGRGLQFDLKGLAGFSVEFKKDPGGRVTEVVFFQPNGTFVAKRKG